MNEFTPIMKQYLRIKAKYKDAFLFFRMGDFYELFFDDAIEASRLLSLTLTKRGKYKGKDIPMAGFPCNSLNTNLVKLVSNGKKVAICEQIGNKKINGILERKVVSLISPGTCVSDDYLNGARNNYISCIHQHNDIYSISSLDVSAGFFITRVFTDINLFIDEIELLSPVEIIMSELSTLKINLDNNINMHIEPHKFFQYPFAINFLKKKLNTKFFDYTKSFKYESGIITIAGLLKYIEEANIKNLNNIISMKFIGTDGILNVDANSKNNLEIFKNFNGNEKDSLISNLDFTTTAMGKRLLKRRLNMPIISRTILNNRKKAVSILKKNLVYNKIIECLLNTFDLERIVGRITLNAAQPIDLKRLELSLKMIPKIREILTSLDLNELLFTILCNLSNSIDIVNLIQKSIHDTPSSSIKENGRIIRDGFDSKLDHLRNIINNREKSILNYQNKECERTGINGLKIEFKSRLGFYIDLSNKIKNIPNDYVLIKTMSNKNRYISNTTKMLENIFITASEKAFLREKKLYKVILYLVKRNIKIIQNTAEHLSELDLLLSFAKQSALYDWSEPELIDECKLIITDARHPVIERKKQGSFVPNNITLDSSKKIFIITGANMGGKSTYMRQIAIITLLAHIGSHVPAKAATIGKFDNIFTRIGASDDLVNSCSTFMIEMKEVAYILEKATDKSLVLIDEIGRGTGYNEGKALAASILKEFIEKKAYVLFSTHFNNLSKIFSSESTVMNIYSKVFYVNKKLVFLYKFKEGIAKNNFAIEVAEMAGLPKNVINNAKMYLSEFENDYRYDYDKIINILRHINIDLISNKKALQVLRIMKNILKKRDK